MANKLEGQSLYDPLTKEVLDVGHRIGLKQNLPKDAANLLMKSYIPEKIFENELCHYTYNLDEHPVPRIRSKTKQEGKKLNAQQRKKLFDVSGATDLKYEMFDGINKLWKSYMEALMNELKQPNDQLNLIRADYHGAYFVVCAARNPAFIGLKGIVIQETKNIFRLISKQDKVLTIPKDSVVFAFEVNGSIHKLNGTQLRMSSHHRSKAKIKSRKYIKDI